MLCRARPIPSSAYSTAPEGDASQASGGVAAAETSDRKDLLHREGGQKTRRGVTVRPSMSPAAVAASADGDEGKQVHIIVEERGPLISSEDALVADGTSDALGHSAGYDPDDMPLAPNEMPLAKTKLKRSYSPPQRGGHLLPSWMEGSVYSDRHSKSKSMVSLATESELRSAKIALERQELERKAEGAIKRQREAAQAKARLDERRRYAGYEFGLQEWEKARMQEEDQQHSPGHRLGSPERERNLSARGRAPISPVLLSARARAFQSTPRPLSARSTDSGYVFSSARGDVPGRDPKEEQAARHQVEVAIKNVKAANDGVLAAQSRIKQRDQVSRVRKYKEAQATYLRKQAASKEEAKQERQEHTEKVKVDAGHRRSQSLQSARDLRRRAQERLSLQAQQAMDEAAHESKESQLKREAQARSMESRARKEADEERDYREAQKEIVEERERVKKENKKFEKEQEKRRTEWLAASRRQKQEQNETVKARIAAEKAREDAAEKARFKAAEAERVKREATKRAQEKAEGRKLREAQRRKQEEERSRREVEMKQKAADLKRALREAAAAQYEADERGKMRLKADPSKEIEKEMRQLEEERMQMVRDREAQTKAREEAFEKRKKEEARLRQLEVEAAQRELAETFKKNQEKLLAERLAREAAEKERFRKIAKETREKIEEDNRRRLEAERQAELHFKEMKAVQYEADLAAHKRIERMKELKAKNYRYLQETEWNLAMDWDAQVTQAQREAREDAMRMFTEQRACKEASKEELRQVKSFFEMKMKADAEEMRATRAVKAVAEAREALEDERDEVTFAANEVKRLKQRSAGTTPQSDHRAPLPADNPFGGFDFLSKFALAPFAAWGKPKNEKQVTVQL